METKPTDSEMRGRTIFDYRETYPNDGAPLVSDGRKHWCNVCDYCAWNEVNHGNNA